MYIVRTDIAYVFTNKPIKKLQTTTIYFRNRKHKIAPRNNGMEIN